MSKLNLVLLWHMHQPFYTDLWAGVTAMPWVRLHGSKAYNDMAAAIEKYPTKVVFNFTGSLIVQLNRLAAGHTDIYFNIAKKPVDELSEEERAFIIDNSFSVNADTLIKPYPRYRKLWEKRRSEGWRPGIEVQGNYTNVELRDLIVCFQLAWTGWDARDRFEEIREIQERGWNYTEVEKNTLLDIDLEICRNVLDRYKSLAREGIIEIIASPYCHPILPLLIDTEIARRAMPWAPMPEPFRFPEDAREQVALGRELTRAEFGVDPVGIWPSEGSVAPEIIPILAQEGFRYFVTDKGVLQRSTGVQINDQSHFNAYLVRHGDSEMAALFRATSMSDMIGFRYTKMPEKDAAQDLLNRLKDISVATGAWENPALYTIALDGENAWEHYQNGGKDFLCDFYRGLSKLSGVEAVLPSQWLEKHPPNIAIQNLHSGSWIRSDFSVWIGDREENEAWEALLETRRDYQKIILAQKTIPDPTQASPVGFIADLIKHIGPMLAKMELFAAEGSDWFWWFGDDFTSDNDVEFDRIFRMHLTNVYRFLNHPAPERLLDPIIRPHPVKPDHEPVAFLHPTIDGKITDYYEWNDGGLYVARAVGGAMYTREVYLEKIFYGFDANALFVRLDRQENAWQTENGGANKAALFPDQVVIEGLAGNNEAEFRIEIPARPGANLPCRLYLPDRSNPELISPPARASAYKIMEISIPFKCLNLKPGMELKFTALLERAGRQLDRYPPVGYLRFEVPDSDFERKIWSA